MRGKVLSWIAQVTVKRYGLVLIVALILTVATGFLASRLELRMTWLDLVPAKSETAIEFNKVLDNYGNASSIIVTVEAADEETVTRAAEEIAPRLLNMNEYIKRVDYKIDTDFISRHGMMLQKVKDIKRTRGFFTDLNLVPFLTNLNDDFEREYVGNEANLRKEESAAIRGLDGVAALVVALDVYAAGAGENGETVRAAIDRFTVGDSYLLSLDRKMLLMIVQPAMSMNDIDLTVAAVNAIEKILDDFEREFPGVSLGMTGMHVIIRDELVTTQSDSMITTLIAFVLILALFIFAFRMWTSPLLAMITLILGIVWTLGVAYIAIGSLSIMTAMTAVILLGLGIDFAIHIIAGYSERRNQGDGILEAVSYTMTRIGPGVLTGGLTTAIAFLALMISDFDALSEFGFVAGVGIISCLVATFFVLPALITLKERIRPGSWSKVRFKTGALEFKFLEKIGGKVAERPILTLLVALVITLLLLFPATQISFDTNLLNIEAKGLESVEGIDKIVERFAMSPDYALATAASIEEAEGLATDYDGLASVGEVGSISLYVPSREKQLERVAYVEEIRDTVRGVPPEEVVDVDALIVQLRRLEDNVLEIADMSFISGLDKLVIKSDQVAPKIAALVEGIEKNGGNKENLDDFQTLFRGTLREKVEGMANPEIITLEMIPESIRQQYTSKDGQHFLVNIFPANNVWQEPFQQLFIRDVKSVDPKTTGTPLMFVEMIAIGGREGRTATLAALVAIIALVIIDFRNLKAAPMAIVPLIMGTIWMLGILSLFDFKLNIINIISVPLILGIGIDDGVHVIHRYLIEGRGGIPTVLRSTGRAILLTSATTMVGFGSLSFAKYQGLATFGVMLFVGVGVLFLVSVFVLPSLLKLTAERWNLNVQPWGERERRSRGAGELGSMGAEEKKS